MRARKVKKNIGAEKAVDWIRSLKLSPHPEGGYYRETYRSAGRVRAGRLPYNANSGRNLATIIYYLLRRDQFSPFHRLRSDEIWHFLDGSPVIIRMIAGNGKYSSTILGASVACGERPEAVIGAGTWFAAELADKTSFALVACMVIPGFEFEDYYEAARAGLAAACPRHRRLIARLTRR